MKSPSRKLAEKIGKSLGQTDEQIAVTTYGLTGIFQFSLILLISLVFGIIFGYWAEVLIIFFSVGFLRRLIGGAHSEGYYSCLVTSILLISGFSLLSHYVVAVYASNHVIAGAVALVYIYSFIEVYRLAPVASPHKPIRTEAKRKRLRRNAFVVLIVFTAISAVLTIIMFFYRGVAAYLSSLALSVLWQVTMLTRGGHRFVGAVDKLFRVNH